MGIVKWVLCGGALPMLLLCVGIFFLFYLRGEPLRSPRGMLRALRAPAPSGGASPMRALLLALAGTLGVGNLVGVANAVAVGGAGAVFWMWISALIAMILKYAEIVLAVRHRRGGRDGFFGGAYYYIKDHFERIGRGRIARILSCGFALLMTLDALSMGCVIQVRAVSQALTGVGGLPLWVGGVALVLLSLPVLLRGRGGVSALTELLVPVMSLGYVILSAAVLILRRDALGDAFGAILRDAFTPSGVGGGVLGFLTSRALRFGTMRGLLSNEAGCGTAPTAHASADAVSSRAQGVFGIAEVFVDTILLCTATALVILVSGGELSTELDPVMLTVGAYARVLGGWSAWFLCGAVFCFGYATVLCWANYGMESVRFLSERPRWRALYLAAFTVCAVFGFLLPEGMVWDVADFSIATLAAINLGMLLLMRREIRRETLQSSAP